MSLVRRILNLLRDDRLSADAEREMAFHLSERADELEATGLPRAEAERRARLRFGNRTVLLERTRDADVLGWLASVRDDLRYAVHPGAGERRTRRARHAPRPKMALRRRVLGPSPATNQPS